MTKIAIITKSTVINFITVYSAKEAAQAARVFLDGGSYQGVTPNSPVAGADSALDAMADLLGWDDLHTAYDEDGEPVPFVDPDTENTDEE